MPIDIVTKIVNSTGLAFDIVGAWFIAWEVTNQFKGEKTHIRGGNTVRRSNLGHTMVDEQPLIMPKQTAEETLPFRQWQATKHLKMKVGIALLTLGFILQIASSWVYLFESNETENINKETKVNTKTIEGKANKLVVPSKTIESPIKVSPQNKSPNTSL